MAVRPGKKQNPGFDNNLFSIYFLDENTGWICGQEGLNPTYLRWWCHMESAKN